jgi:hypothetical protein
LLEPITTNLVTYSEDFSQWTTAGDITLENGYLAPDGTNTAYKISSAGLTGFVYDNIGSGVTTTTKSIYARSVSGTGQVKLLSKNDNTNNTFTLTEQWQRFELNSTTSAATLFYAVDFRADATLNEIIVWGANATNDQTYATSYIPTLTGSTETRATETANGAGSADLINSTEGVLYAEIAALDDGISQQIGVYGNSTTKQLRLEIANSVIRAQLFNGAYQANMSSTQTVTNFNKIAFKWKVNDFALWINGTEVATDSSGSTFPANDLDRLNLSGQNGSSNLAQAKIKSVVVFNTALTDAELTELTS